MDRNNFPICFQAKNFTEMRRSQTVPGRQNNQSALQNHTISSRQKSTLSKVPNNTSHHNPTRDIPKISFTEKSRLFRQAYSQNQLPVKLDHSGPKTRLKWTQKPEDLDFEKWLPIFGDGVIETEPPFNMLAQMGLVELIELGKDLPGNPVLETLPFFIPALR